MDALSSNSGPASRYQPLVPIFVSLSAGIVFDRFWGLSFFATWVLGFVAWLGWVWFWKSKSNRLSAIVLLTALFFLGAIWHHVRWNATLPQEKLVVAQDKESSGKRICIEGTLFSAPEILPAPPTDPMNPIPTGDLSRVKLQIQEVRNGMFWEQYSGQATMLVDGHLLDVYAGDRVRVFGTLRYPNAPHNVGDFDRRAILRLRGDSCDIRAKHPSCVQVVSRGSWVSVRRWFFQFRRDCNALLWRYVPHEQASLAAAILLGAREQIDEDRTEGFFLTGTIHLLAISGLHVGMLAYMIWFVARIGVTSRQGAVLATAAAIIIYALLTNSRPPVMRATILIVTLCTARMFGRQLFSFNTLAIAGTIVLLVNPAQLFQAGTQLSFLAVATLVCCAPWLMPKPIDDPLDRLIANSRPWPERIARQTGDVFWRLWLTSTMVWLVALPLVLARFHLVSPIAIFLNPVLMLPIAMALFGGFGVLVFGWICPPLGWVCGWICGTSLSFIEFCVEHARPIPGSHFFLPAPAIWWVALTYAGLAVLVYFPNWRPAARWGVASCLIWVVVGLQTTQVDRPPPEKSQSLHCTFVAVGHGTCVVIELPNGQTMLYDTGRLGNPQVASRAVANYLWSRGITHVDAVVLSHADADHYNALPGILERVSAGVVYVSPVMFNESSRPLDHLRESIESRGIAIREMGRGDRLQVGAETSIQVLHPPAHGRESDDVSDNANSIVLQIDFDGRRILLPGDIEPPGLDLLLLRPQLDCDVVMAPHHGSAGSNPAGFSYWTQPEWVIVSGGNRSGLDEVKQTFRTAGAQVLHTVDGAIQVSIESGDLTLTKWEEDHWKRVESVESDFEER